MVAFDFNYTECTCLLRHDFNIRVSVEGLIQILLRILLTEFPSGKVSSKITSQQSSNYITMPGLEKGEKDTELFIGRFKKTSKKFASHKKGVGFHLIIKSLRMLQILIWSFQIDIVQ